MDRSIMGREDCWLIPQGKEKDMIRQMLGRKLEEKKSRNLERGETIFGIRKLRNGVVLELGVDILQGQKTERR